MFVFFLPPFTSASLPMFTHVYSWLPMFALIYLCLHVYSRVYLLSRVYVSLRLFYSYIFIYVYPVYLCLLLFTYVYSCLPMFTNVYSCMFTYVYHCLLVHVYLCLINIINGYMVVTLIFKTKRFCFCVAKFLVLSCHRICDFSFPLQLLHMLRKDIPLEQFRQEYRKQQKV